MKKTYSAPRVHDLGSAVVLTKGSYPHTPETHGTTDHKITRVRAASTVRKDHGKG